MSDYDHPGDPQVVMTRYRQYILNTKRKANADRVSHGRPPARRVARALIHYRKYIDTYLAAKRQVLAAKS